ncbi:translocation/assembly module TamB domain-containing protein [Pseudoruegeria sp. HB172150]|uniref:translocation/assembly module TamB domain-containing protein n=1 Tax=Pseudoruegeria sp. HB172150 TaxID=2721164 RepID=UPI0015531290|nr:translocation/assembly module TamB domain-containing protein [Pseudoruegeria sp. HB172150]
MRFLTFLLLIVTLPFAALAQSSEEEERDRGLLQRLIEDNLSSAGREVQIEGFRGALSSSASLDRMTIADSEGVWLTLENATLNWQRTALLRGRLQVQELSAERLVIARAPVTEEEAPTAEAPGFSFALPDLPVAVNIDQFNIDRVELGAPILGEELALNVTGSANLTSGEGVADLSITRLDGPEGEIGISASYSNTTGELVLDLNFNEGPGGIAAGLIGMPGDPAVQLIVSGDGTLDDFAAEIELATDGVERLGGTVSFASVEPEQAPAEGEPPAPTAKRFSAQLSGDITPLMESDYIAFFGDDISLNISGVRQTDGSIDLDRLALQARSIALDGTVSVSAEGWPEQVDITGRVVSPEGGEVLLGLPGAQTWMREADLSVQYDQAAGDNWTASFEVLGLRRLDMATERVALTGNGTLSHGDGVAIGQVGGAFDLEVTPVQHTDPGLAEALAEGITGGLEFSYAEGEALTFPGFDLTIGDARLAGRAEVGGLSDGGNVRVDADVSVTASDIARFSTLAGRDLGGSAELSVSGWVEPLGGAFDLSFDGTTQDLALDVEQLDPLITGEGTLSANVARGAEGVQLDNLAIVTDATNLSASGTLATGAGSGRISLTVADAALAVPGLDGPASLNGAFALEGDDWDLDIAVEGPGGLNADMDGTVTLTDGTPRAFTGVLDLAVDALEPYSELAGRRLGGAADLSIRGSGDLEQLTGRTEVSGTTSDLIVDVEIADAILAGDGTLDVAVTREADGSIIIERGRAQTPQLRADVSGSYTPESSDLRFDVAMSNMGLVLPSLTGPVSARGTAQATGDDWTVDTVLTGPGELDATLSGNVSLPDWKPTDFSGDLDIAVASLAPYSELAGRTLGGGADLSIRASGNVPDLTGRAEVSGTTSDLIVDVEIADALLAGDGTLDISVARAADGSITVDRGRAETPQLRADVSGSYTPEASDLTFDVAMSDLGLVAPNLNGPVTARGTAQATGDDWTVDTSLTGPGELDATLSGTVSLPDWKPTDFSADLDFAVASLDPYSGLAGRTLGGGADLSITASGNASTLTGSAEVSGTARSLSIGIPDVDALLRGDSTVDIAVSRSEDGTVNVQRARVQTPQLSASFDGNYGSRGGTLTFEARLNDLGLFAPGISGPVTAQGSARSTGGDWTVDVSATGPGGITSRVTGTAAPDFQSANLNAVGAGPLELVNRFISPNLVSGRLDYNLSLNGPLALNSVSGTASTSNASLTVPVANVRLTGINATANLNSGQVQLSVDASSAEGGRLRVTGSVGMTAPFNGDLSVDLFNLGLVDPGLYETTVSGGLTVTGPLTGGAMIAGNLTLGPVEVRIPDGFGSSGGSLPSLVHLYEPADVRLTRKRAGMLETDSSRKGTVGYGLDVRIDAPSRIFIRGRGLDAEMGGSLRVTGTTTAPVTQGGFELIRGRLDVLSERIDLTEGSIRLQGDFNPYIRMVATTTSGDITVEIVIEGFADNPELTVTSSPELPEEEILAHLLFGQSVTDISALQALQLASAVRTLSGAGGTGIVERLRQNSGLDDLEIVTSEDGSAGVRAGKYLSDNLYTSVEVNSDGETEINLNLNITNSVTARGMANSEGDTGIGIYFERDY